MTRYLIDRHEKLTRRASKGSSTCCAGSSNGDSVSQARQPMTHTRAFIIASEALLVHIAQFQIPATYHRSSTRGFSYQAYRDNGKESETTVDFSLVAMSPCDPPGAIRFLAADRNNSPTRKRDRNHQPKNIGR